MRAAAVLLALGAAVVGVAAASSGKKRAPLRGASGAVSALNKRTPWRSAFLPFDQSFRVRPYLIDTTQMLSLEVDGKDIRDFPSGTYINAPAKPGSPQEQFQNQARFALATFNDWVTKNRALLPADADPNYVDRYSKTVYHAPAFLFFAARNPQYAKSITIDDLSKQIVGMPLDEFGRSVPGDKGSGGGILDPFVNLLKNPLFQVVLAAAAFAFGGPAGLAAYGAFNAYVIRGEELTVKSVALTAARTAAVSQCGPACGAAFDIGVGVASGDSIDQAAKKAALGAMSPTERAYYDQGVALYEQNKGAIKL